MWAFPWSPLPGWRQSSPWRAQGVQAAPPPLLTLCHMEEWLVYFKLYLSQTFLYLLTFVKFLWNFYAFFPFAWSGSLPQKYQCLLKQTKQRVKGEIKQFFQGMKFSMLSCGEQRSFWGMLETVCMHVNKNLF